MRRALVLAARGAGQTSPNPMVGAVVVKDGAVVGEGWHARFGGMHAEVAALTAAGSAASGATLYVTLEPCNHSGKTPPCVDAILRADVRRVVYAISDPHTHAAGGATRLRENNVDMIANVCRAQASELNAPFFFATHGQPRPFVTLKLALSIDGAVADASGQPRQLTGRVSRRAVHALRREADAIAVGINTALVDDPALTVRDVSAPRITPVRVVFDRHARLPLHSQLVRTARDIPVWVVASSVATEAATPQARADQRERTARLEHAGVRVIASASLADVLGRLRTDEVRHLLVEGGAGLASAFIAAGCVDRLVILQAPVILGAGALPGFASLASAAADRLRLTLVHRRTMGDDLMSTYAVVGD